MCNLRWKMPIYITHIIYYIYNILYIYYRFNNYYRTDCQLTLLNGTLVVVWSPWVLVPGVVSSATWRSIHYTEKHALLVLFNSRGSGVVVSDPWGAIQALRRPFKGILSGARGFWGDPHGAIHAIRRLPNGLWEWVVLEGFGLFLVIQEWL